MRRWIASVLCFGVVVFVMTGGTAFAPDAVVETAAGTWISLSEDGEMLFLLFFHGSGEDEEEPKRTGLVYVDASAVGLADGTSWQNAFTALQDALAVASAGCEIRVAEGLYRPDVGGHVSAGDPNATFLIPEGVTVRGGFAGASGADPNLQDRQAHPTVLSGDLAGDDVSATWTEAILDAPDRVDNCRHVVSVLKTETPVVLEGLIVTGGAAHGVQYPDMTASGGGVYCYESDVLVRDCAVVSNSAVRYGAGLLSVRSNLTLQDCLIANNFAQWYGGGLFIDITGTCDAQRCTIRGNVAIFRGGGLFCGTNAQAVLTNCIVGGNLAAHEIYSQGGAVFSHGGYLSVTNCTLTGNMAALGSALGCSGYRTSSSATAALANCILWNEQDEIWIDGVPRCVVSHCDVRAGWPGEGNIDTEPGFYEPGHWEAVEVSEGAPGRRWIAGDYHLPATSACVDAGQTALVPEAVVTDFEGDGRVSGLAVDMGAFEYCNDPPIANAGGDREVYIFEDATAMVTLDGTGSHTPEGEPLSYAWYKGGELVSDQPRPLFELAGGVHPFSLVVDNGTQQSESGYATVTVTETTSVTIGCTPDAIGPAEVLPMVRVMLLLPRSMRRLGYDPGWRLLLDPFGVRAVQQRAVKWATRGTLIVAYFDGAEVLGAAPDLGPIQVRAVGRFRDGSYFSGVDTLIVTGAP